MKKNYLKLFFGLSSLLLFTTNVNASVGVCNSGSGDTTITEKSITYAGFEATMPKCVWEPSGDYKSINSNKDEDFFDTYDEALNSGYDRELKMSLDVDGKSLTTTPVTKCGDEKRTVSAIVNCTKSVKAEEIVKPNTCSGTAKENCKGDCSWDEDEIWCTGDNSYTYYVCPDGFELDEDVKMCEKKVSIDLKKDVSSGSAKSDAEKECMEGNKYKCECEEPKYYLKCPIYKCSSKVYKNYSVCTPDFEINGQPAYCVNPSQGFVKDVNNYQYDNTFNVLNCASSYSTVDCGYANILIEGAYYSAPDDAINTALRLWSIHSGQVGDKKTGLARLTGKNCDKITYFPTDDDNNNVNVYKRTHDYIMDIARAKFYDVARRYTHIPVEENAYTKNVLTGNTFEKITCLVDKSMAGVMCGDSTEYRIGFELFFNTIIGNKYMKEHLATLYGGVDGVKPTGAILQSEYSFEEHKEEAVKESWVEVQYEHMSFFNYIKGEEVGCSDAKLNELKNKLVEEGKTQSEADGIINQIRPYCQVKATVVDEDGNILVTQQDLEKCVKGSGCRTRKFKFAICDITQNNEKDIEIKLKYERTKSSYSVRKYIACANADINQTLFAFFKDESGGGSGSGSSTIGGTNTIVDTYSVTNYKCAGGCDNSSLRTSGEDSCKNDTNNYNGVYKSKIKDPSLKCIVNLNDSSSKSKYDYSDYFGVNTNFCRVYCSDEIEYILPDKVKATSGRTFNYNIEFPAKGTNKASYQITSIVKEKRSCVSEIYYNHLENLDVIRNDYGLNEDELNELKKSKTFAGLFKILKNKADSENDREEVLNQIIYDIYNCNFYSENAIKNAGVDIPQNYKTTLIKKVNDIYANSNNYGLGSDKSGKKTEESNVDIVKYGFGAKIKDTKNRVNNVSNSSIVTGKLSQVSYCKNENGNLCYGYDSNNDEISYNYPANKVGNLQKYELFKGKKINVPTNDFARFEVTTEINYYNDNKYQVDYGSGKVFLGKDNADLMTLADYSYPIDKDAYNLNVCKTSIEDGKYHRCTVNQVLNPLMFYRNESSYKLTVNDDNKFKCYIDVEMPSPNCDPSKNNCNDHNATIYRNVDPANIFPSGNLKENSNWSTEDGLKAKESIESTADELKTNEKYLDYSITLSPSQIKNIKKYNSSNSSYIDEATYNCEKDSDKGIYYNCNSQFMDILRGNNSEFSSGSYGNINVDRK